IKGMDTNVIGDQGSVEPPDTDMAAGPNEVVEIVNSAIAFYSKTGTPIGGTPEDLVNFFAPADPAPSLYSDVGVVYDEQAGRWLTYTMDLDPFNEITYFVFAV